MPLLYTKKIYASVDEQLPLRIQELLQGQGGGRGGQRDQEGGVGQDGVDKTYC